MTSSGRDVTVGDTADACVAMLPSFVTASTTYHPIYNLLVSYLVGVLHLYLHACYVRVTFCLKP